MISASKSVLALSLGVAVGTIPFHATPSFASGFSAAQEAQSPTPKAANRLIGTVTAVQGNTITIKTDAGVESSLTVTGQTKIVRTAPGQKDLTGATPIQVSDIQLGDRVLSRITPSEDGKSNIASSIITMAKTDLAQRKQQEREAWQHGGISGLVQAVDPGAQTVTVKVPQNGIMTLHLTPATVLRRYAPNSTKFDDAKPAPISDIKTGDQLRARGKKDTDGKDFNADEIVSGTFPSIAATVVATDTAANTVTVNNLATKKPMTLHIAADSQLHKLPAEMAQHLAMALKMGGSQAGGAVAGRPPMPAGVPAGAAGPPHTGMPPGGADPQQMLARTPGITLSELKKGDALMIVSTEGSASAPASVVMLVAGVEPILQASPSATQNMLSSWSLGANGGGADAQ